MNKVKTIYTHHKGNVKRLVWVGEHPIDPAYSIWVESKLKNGGYILHEIENKDLQDKHYYSDVEKDMVVKAFNYLTIKKGNAEQFLNRH